MPPRLITADDIRRLAHARTEILVLGQGDILTQEAAETAYALGTKVIRDAGAPASGLPALRVVRLADLQVQPFLEGQATPGTNVWSKDIITSGDPSPMQAGYMSLDQGEMQRVLACDELEIVLEGELLVRRGPEQVRARTGDVIFIPKGSTITFGTPNWARFVYVVRPAQREEK